MANTYHFHPAIHKQEKISFECSLPRSQSSIRNVTKALPFPFDISEALDYSAAYIGHAAHIAKHAQEQFNSLESHHKDLHAKSNNQVKEIADLKCHVRDHEQDIRGLNSEYAELEKQRERDAKQAKDREDALKKQLADTQAELRKAQSYITQDKLDDVKRDNAHHEHISADHLIIKQTEERAVKAEAQVVKLQVLLDTTNKKFAVSEATLKTVREQLVASQATVAKLTADVAAEKQAKEKMQAELKTTQAELQQAQIDNAELTANLNMKTQLLERAQAKVEAKDLEVDERTKQRDDITKERDAKTAEVNRLEEEQKLIVASLKADHALAMKNLTKPKTIEMKVPIVTAKTVTATF